MSDDRTIDLLNRLYAAESSSLLPRLLEVNPFTSAHSAARLDLVRRIAGHSREHCEWLVEAIESADGCVRPVSPDPRSGNLHYLSIDALLPLVRRSLEGLVSTYQAATSERLVSYAAADLVARCLARYRHDLEQLQTATAASA